MLLCKSCYKRALHVPMVMCLCLSDKTEHYVCDTREGPFTGILLFAFIFKLWQNLPSSLFLSASSVVLSIFTCRVTNLQTFFTLEN